MNDLVLREVVVDGRLVDVRASGGVIVEIDRRVDARPGDDEVDGPIDRWHLDALVPDRPVRVQHRAGGAWVLNTRGLDLIGVDDTTDRAGVERDGDGQPTGRLLGLDRWLRERLPPHPVPDLAAVGRRLTAYGVTGVTDATPAGVGDDP